MPPVGALDRLRAANGDEGVVGRLRSNARLVVAIAGGGVLLLAWIGWAIHVTSDHGARAGLGVVIVWPAMLAALVVISLPFIGGYLLIRRLASSEGEGSAETVEAESAEEEDGAEDQEDEEDEDSAEEGDDSQEENVEDEDEDDSEEEDVEDEDGDSEEEDAEEPKEEAKSS